MFQPSATYATRATTATAPIAAANAVDDEHARCPSPLAPSACHSVASTAISATQM